MLSKILIVLALLAILGSLGSALIFLIKDDGRSNRAVKALTFRIGLSVALFALLMLGIYTGVIKPHGIYPTQPPPNSNTPSAP